MTTPMVPSLVVHSIGPEAGRQPDAERIVGLERDVGGEAAPETHGVRHDVHREHEPADDQPHRGGAPGDRRDDVHSRPAPPT